MDPLRLLCESRGFFTRAESRDLGYTDKDVTRLVRGRVWVRIRRGYYAYADLWSALDEVERHRARSHAVMHSLGNKVALSHTSAAVQHGLSTWGLALERVHVTRLDGGPGRVEGDVVHHEGFALEQDLLEIDGRLVVAADRAAIEVASRAQGDVPLCVLDSVLHLGLCTQEQLMARFAQMARWPFVRRLHVPIRMADGRAESPGESRGRWLCWKAGLPVPQPQFQVFDRDGVLVGTTDWAWLQHGLLGEFDGMSKYGRLLKPGQDVADVVRAEKEREDLLRELTDMRMIRLVWTDYERPRFTAARIERKLRQLG